MKKIVFYCFIFFTMMYILAYSDVGKDLIMAVVKGRFELVKELVEKGKDVNAYYDSKGRTPLHWAVIRDNLKIAVFLISKGANVGIKDKNMMSPIHYTAFTKNLDMVKLLVQEGADVNALDKNGWSPLHYFAFYDFDMGVKYLLMQGAIQSVQSSNRYMGMSNKSTPLDVAIQKNNSNIIQALLNPDKYLRLSQKPYLSLSLKEDFGEDGVLMAPEKKFLLFNIENKGGVAARNVRLIVEGVSNTEGLLIDEPEIFDLYSGGSVNVSIGIEATKEIKPGKAVLKVYAKETNYFRTSEIITINISVLPPQPPAFLITASWETNKFILGAKEKSFLRFLLKNTGKGKSENAFVYAVPVNGCEEINFSSITNIHLLPGESRNVDMIVETSEELKDGFADFFVVAGENEFNVAITNRFKIETRHLFKPFFIASLSFREKYQTLYVTNFISNDTTTINEKLPYVISMIVATNFEPEILLFNKGEATGRNISIRLNLNEIGDTNKELHSFNFVLPELSKNSVRIFTLPYFITNYIGNSNVVADLFCADEEKYSVFETNFQIMLKE